MTTKICNKKQSNFGKWIAVAMAVSGIFGAVSLHAQTPQIPRTPNPAQTPTTTGTAIKPIKPLRVGFAGNPPFITNTRTGPGGISWEIWQALADQAGWDYTTKNYPDVPSALADLQAGKMDVLVGPVSITSDRAQHAIFTQPYFQSSLAILSRAEPPTLWHRLRPFFSRSFFICVGVLLLVLAIVGSLIWLAERRDSKTEFPRDPARGIANGVWFAVVTMTTVGYGDRVPKTLFGRIVAGVWMILSLIVATSLIAGIASTLALSSIASVQITTAEQMRGRKIAVLEDSPSISFVRQYGGKMIAVASIDEGFKRLKNQTAEALVYDRPALLYFLKNHPDSDLRISKAEYMRQGYGFALPLNSKLARPLDIDLLKLDESGRIKRILGEWLGEDDD